MAFRRDFITVNYAAIIVPRGRVCVCVWHGVPRPSSSLESGPSRGGLETEKGCAINPGKSSLYDNGLSVDRSVPGTCFFFF